MRRPKQEVPLSPLRPQFPELSVAPPRLPESSARARGLSDFNHTGSGLVRPHIRNIKARASVHN